MGSDGVRSPELTTHGRAPGCASTAVAAVCFRAHYLVAVLATKRGRARRGRFQKRGRLGTPRGGAAEREVSALRGRTSTTATDRRRPQNRRISRRAALSEDGRGSADGPRAAAGVGLAVPPAAPETLLRALLTPYSHRSRGPAGAAWLLRPARRVGALEEPAGGLHQHAGAAGAAGGLRVVAALAAVPVRAAREMPAPASNPPQVPCAGTAGAAARAWHRFPHRLEPRLERVRGGREPRVRAFDDRPGHRRGDAIGIGHHDQRRVAGARQRHVPELVFVVAASARFGRDGAVEREPGGRSPTSAPRSRSALRSPPHRPWRRVSSGTRPRGCTDAPPLSAGGGRAPPRRGHRAPGPTRRCSGGPSRAR